jgi:hypothetical protein
MKQYFRHLFGATLCLFASMPVTAQSGFVQTVIPGATWTLEIGQGMGSNIQVDHTITCDTTTIRDQEYLRVTTPLQTDCGAGGFVREDTEAGQVFFIPAEDPDLAEYLVADYSLEVGDTFFVNRGAFPAVVQEIRAIERFGDTVRFIDFGPQVNGGLIEGYGSSATGILAGCPGFAQVVDYQVDAMVCGVTTSILQPFPTGEVRLFPNPVHAGTLQVDVDPSFGEVRAQVFSTFGQPVGGIVTGRDRLSLFLDRVPPGLVFIRLSAKGYQEAFRVIVL